MSTMKIKCKCGSVILRNYLQFHKLSKKHIDFENGTTKSNKTNQRIECECGSIFQFGHMRNHCNTKKHINYLYGSFLCI
jgi:hypothetical protein